MQTQALQVIVIADQGPALAAMRQAVGELDDCVKLLPRTPIELPSAPIEVVFLQFFQECRICQAWLDLLNGLPKPPIIFLLTDEPLLVQFWQQASSGIADLVQAQQLDAQQLQAYILYAEQLLAERQSHQMIREALRQSTQQLREQSLQMRLDLEAGHEVQKKLFPDAALAHSGYQFRHLLLASHFLSGDFVDYFALDSKRVVAVLADVSGHGVSSALATVMLKIHINALRSEFQLGQNQTILQPEQVLSRLNQELLASRLDKHATLFWMMVDFDLGCLHCANAAHLPLPRLVLDQQAQSLEPTGMALGMMAEAQWQTRVLHFQSKLAVFACSDGVFEIMPEMSLLAKEQRLLNILDQVDWQIEDLVEALHADGAATMPDDITLFVMQKLR